MKTTSTFQSYLSAAILFVLFWGAQMDLSAKVIYVKWDASGANNGQSWADAYNDLQDGLAAAEFGDQIWVAKGKYTPTKSDDRSISFHMKRGVELYGGFEGNESNASDRDWANHQTVLSGAIQKMLSYEGNQIVVHTIYSYHVVQAIDVEDKAILDGFIIEEGRADSKESNSFDDSGGGLLIRSTSIKEFYPCPSSSNNPKSCIKQHASNPTIRNSTFRNNFAKRGGAVAGFSSRLYGKELSPGFSNCQFWNNEAKDNGGGVYISLAEETTSDLVFQECNFYNHRGGGINIYGGSSDSDAFGTLTLQIEGCKFENNRDLGAFEGILTYFEVEAYITRSHFLGNEDDTINEDLGGGGAVEFTLNSSEGSLVIDRCGFEDNWSLDGGALLVERVDKLQVSNSAFIQNSSDVGGAISGSPIEFVATNNTFWGNEARYQGGAMWIPIQSGGESYSPTRTYVLENNIFWGNIITNISPPVNEWQVDIEFLHTPTPPAPISPNLQASHNIFEGGLPARFTDLGGNTFSDPLFYSTANPNGSDNQLGTSDDGIRLSSKSPAINTGLNAAIGLLGLNWDILNNQRIYDGTVDKGAYEFGAPSLFSAPEKPNIKFVLFPNPASKYVEVQLEDSKTGTIRFEMRDLRGEVYYRESLDKRRDQLSHEIDVSRIPEGIYLFQSSLGERISTQRLVIDRSERR